MKKKYMVCFCGYMLPMGISIPSLHNLYNGAGSCFSDFQPGGNTADSGELQLINK